MKEASPKTGAGSDDSHRGHGSLTGIAPAGHLWIGCVRTGSSCAEAIEFCHRQRVGSFSISRTTGATRVQSERDLDLPEAAGRRAEGRASGKSAAQRSEQRETSCGWRGVAVALHAEEGQRHE